MTICREWSLVKTSDPYRHVKPLYCRSWSCEICQPKRRRRLMAQAAGGCATRFMTLTVNPRVLESPEARLRALAGAWRTIVKRLHRLHPGQDIAYFAVVEETQRGEPHLHVLLRSPFIPQAWLSQAMDGLLESPIVDIRKIKSASQVVRYIAKYIAKAPAQFGTSKRYWCTQNWEAKDPDATAGAEQKSGSWQVVMATWQAIIHEWTYEGYIVRKEEGETLVAWPQGCAPPGLLAQEAP